jgi:hypothetical protein
VERIIRSLTPAALLVAAAVVFALGTAFVLASDASLSASSPNGSSDLAQAGRWLQFLAVACLLGAVCTAGWDATVRSEWAAAAETGAAAVGTLLLTIGFAAFAASNGASPAAPVTSAVGIGVWALLVLSRAARVSLAEQGPAPVAVPSAVGAPAGPGGGRRQAELWLAAAIGLFVLAIGYGFTAASGSRGTSVAAGLLEAAGAAILAGAVRAARARQLLPSRPVPYVLIGLALFAVSFLAYAIVAGVDFGSVGALSAALTIVDAVGLAAAAVLGLAAWTQVRALYPAPRPGAASPPASPPAGPPAGQPPFQ